MREVLIGLIWKEYGYQAEQKLGVKAPGNSNLKKKKKGKKKKKALGKKNLSTGIKEEVEDTTDTTASTVLVDEEKEPEKGPPPPGIYTKLDYYLFSCEKEGLLSGKPKLAYDEELVTLNPYYPYFSDKIILDKTLMPKSKTKTKLFPSDPPSDEEVSIKSKKNTPNSPVQANISDDALALKKNKKNKKKKKKKKLGDGEEILEESDINLIITDITELEATNRVQNNILNDYENVELEFGEKRTIQISTKALKNNYEFMQSAKASHNIEMQNLNYLNKVMPPVPNTTEYIEEYRSSPTTNKEFVGQISKCIAVNIEERKEVLIQFGEEEEVQEKPTEVALFLTSTGIYIYIYIY